MKGRKTILFRISIALFLCVAAQSALNQSALAEHRDVPPSLISYREQLLQLRDQLLERRQEENRCLLEDENTIRTLDASLLAAENKPTWDVIQGWKAARVVCINKHHGAIADLERGVIEVDRNLARAESEITAWAKL